MFCHFFVKYKRYNWKKGKEKKLIEIIEMTVSKQIRNKIWLFVQEADYWKENKAEAGAEARV